MTHDQALITLARAVQSLSARVAALEQAGPASVPAEVVAALAELGAHAATDNAGSGTVAVPGIE